MLGPMGGQWLGPAPRTQTVSPRLFPQQQHHIDSFSPPHSILTPDNNRSPRNGTNLPSSVIWLASTD